ncbi:hypothetical protein ENBRE01_1015, partial [Enteropsectra breve]
KVDTSTAYRIFKISDLADTELEDYVEVRDTGMEADEEKEEHLQRIIQGRGRDIPIPVVKEISNPARALYKNKKIKKIVIWNKDCENEYILTELDKNVSDHLVEQFNVASHNAPLTINNILHITENRVGSSMSEKDAIFNMTNEQLYSMEKIRAVKNTPQNAPSVNLIAMFGQVGESSPTAKEPVPGIIDFVMNRILVRYDRNGHEAYSCFRKRVFYPTFKFYRNEALVGDKLARLGGELSGFKKCANFYLEKLKYQEIFLRQTDQLIETFRGLRNSNEIAKKELKKYYKKILCLPEEHTAKALTMDTHAMMINRTKIACMRQMAMKYNLLVDPLLASDFMEAIEKKEEHNGQHNRKYTKHIEDNIEREDRYHRYKRFRSNEN